MIRIDSEVLEQAKEMARRSHRSFNNFIECLLIDITRNQPNELTLTAMREIRSSALRNSTPVDLTSIETMLKSAGI